MDLTKNLSFETVYVDGKERDNTSISSSNFEYTIKDSISIDTEQLSQARLTQVLIPHSFYHINANNNVIPFDDNGTIFDAVITPGTYTHTQLATEIATAINAGAGVNTVSVIYDTNKDVFTTTSPANFRYLWALNPSLSTALANIVMGYTIVDTALALTSSSSQSPKISPTSLLLTIGFDEQSQEIGQTKFGRHTFVIPIVSDFGLPIIYKPDTPMLVQRFNKNTVIKKINVRLYDLNYPTVDLDMRGRDIELEVRFQN